MCAGPGVDEADHPEPLRIDEPDPVGGHISDIEDLAVGRQAYVLRHAVPGPGGVMGALIGFPRVSVLSTLCSRILIHKSLALNSQLDTASAHLR